VAHNLLNQLADGRLKALVEKVLDPKKHPIITAELINELSHEVATGTFEKREAQCKLTGEWIILRSIVAKTTTCACPRTTPEIKSSMTRSSQRVFTSSHFYAQHRSAGAQQGRSSRRSCLRFAPASQRLHRTAAAQPPGAPHLPVSCGTVSHPVGSWV
jgi:hypothetical protein